MDISFIMAFVFGAILLILSIILALRVPHPTPSQWYTFRIVLALAASGVVAAVPGSLQIESNLTGLALRAGGALAVLVLALRYIPELPPERRREPQKETGGCLWISLFLVVAVVILVTLKGPEIGNVIQSFPVLPEEVLPLRKELLEINQTEYSSNMEGFTVTLTTIQFIENDRMRWNFEFWNQSTKDRRLSFDYSETYLVDEFGNRYPVLSVDANVDPNGTYVETLPMGIRVNHWFEFSSPKDGAKLFNVILADNNLIPLIGGVEFRRPLFVVNLTEY